MSTARSVEIGRGVDIDGCRFAFDGADFESLVAQHVLCTAITVERDEFIESGAAEQDWRAQRIGESAGNDFVVGTGPGVDEKSQVLVINARLVREHEQDRIGRNSAGRYPARDARAHTGSMRWIEDDVVGEPGSSVLHRVFVVPGHQVDRTERGAARARQGVLQQRTSVEVLE